MRVFLARIAPWCVGVGLAVLPSIAAAQPKPVPAKGAAGAPAPAGDAALADARQRFSEGIDLADAGEHEAARTKFTQAWVLLKSPVVLYNLARSEQLSGHLVEALDHFRQFNRMASDPVISNAQRQRASENVAELTKRLGQIDVEAAAGSRISVDGRATEATVPGDPIAVTPGKHVVEASLDGKVHRATVEAQAGTIAKAKLDDPASLSARPAERPAAPPTTAPSSSRGEAGSSGAKAITTVGLAIVGLAGVGLGIGFLVDSNSAVGEAKDFNRSIPGGACAQRALPTCDDYSRRLDDATTSRTISIVSFASGGAFALGSILALALWPSGSSQKSAALGATVRPVLGPSAIGLSGTF